MYWSELALSVHQGSFDERFQRFAWVFCPTRAYSSSQSARSLGAGEGAMEESARGLGGDAFFRTDRHNQSGTAASFAG